MEGLAVPVGYSTVLDQRRKPAKGDIVALPRGRVRAKIRSRVGRLRGYYNVDMEDGTAGGVYLRPPVNNVEESWSLLPPSKWDPSLSQMIITQI